jgi:phage terminase large subunit GpA-like protein
LPQEFYDQLTAEHRIRVRQAHGWAERWVCPSGHRNEVLDCTVGCLFLIQVLGLHNTPASVWERWEANLTPDLFATPPETTAPESETTAQESETQTHETVPTSAPSAPVPLPPRRSPSLSRRTGGVSRRT